MVSSFIILLLTVACGSDSPITKTVIWEPYDGEAIYIDVPPEWEWDEVANSLAQDEAESGDIPKRYLWVPSSGGEHPPMTMGFWSGPIDEWVDIQKGVAEESDYVLHFRHWNGDLNGVPATFEDQSYTDSRLLEVYVMPEGNQWAWRFGCATNVAEKEQLSVCESIIGSIRLD